MREAATASIAPKDLTILQATVKIQLETWVLPFMPFWKATDYWQCRSCCPFDEVLGED
jgi:hypothetical protein